MTKCKKKMSEDAKQASKLNLNMTQVLALSDREFDSMQNLEIHGNSTKAVGN